MNLQIFSLTPMAFTALIALAPPAAAGDSLLASPIELAQSAPPAQGRGPQGGPPPREAFEACASKAEGEACAFSTQDDTVIEGACRQPPRGRDNAMVCVPSDASG